MLLSLWGDHVQRSDLCCSVGVYYLRAESLAYKRLVDHLRKIVALEVKDKEFLLNKIARVIESRK